MAIKLKWWKILTIVLVIYTLIAGLLMPVPRLAILHETIRNLYYHVPMWFGMIAILAASVWYSIVYLRTFDLGKLHLGRALEQRPQTKRIGCSYAHLLSLFCASRSRRRRR